MADLWRRLGQFVRNQPPLERFLDRVLRPVERITKGAVFGCHMCGQCVLHSTGMVCPMNCPKKSSFLIFAPNPGVSC